MSTSCAVTGSYQTDYRALSANRADSSHPTVEDEAIAAKLAGANEVGDRVELSEEAKILSSVHHQTKVNEDRAAFEAKMREQVEKLTTSRKDLDSHINTVLEKAGLKLKGGEKLRVETNAAGKIKVSGIEDKERRKQIEEALNRESGLNKKVQEHNSLYRKTSSELKSDTGMSLYELMQLQKGLFEPSFKKLNPDGSEETITRLNQLDLFENNPELEGMLTELNGDPAISFVTDSNAASAPENTLRKYMNESMEEIRKAFQAKNDETLAKAEEAGIEIDEEFRKNHLLKFDLSSIALQIGSDKSIEIEGDVAGDESLNRYGKDLINQILTANMEKTDETGEINLFGEATKRIVEDYELEFGDEAADDAKVLINVGKGHKGAELRLSSPSKEAELDNDIKEKANEMIQNMVDFPLEMTLNVTVNDKGKLSVDNLPGDQVQQAAVLQALEVLNAAITTGNELDEATGPLTRMVRHRKSFMPGGIHNIYKHEDRNTTVTMTEYSAASWGERPQTAETPA